MQSMPQYRGTTTFIITTDHGRGSGLTEWKEHGVDQKGSESIWVALIGPDTPALGERRGGGVLVQAQLAATVAALWAGITRARSRAPRRRSPTCCTARRPAGGARQPPGFYIIVRIL